LATIFTFFKKNLIFYLKVKRDTTPDVARTDELSVVVDDKNKVGVQIEEAAGAVRQEVHKVNGFTMFTICRNC
jgi:hypothetical protein